MPTSDPPSLPLNCTPLGCPGRGHRVTGSPFLNAVLLAGHGGCCQRCLGDHPGQLPCQRLHRLHPQFRHQRQEQDPQDAVRKAHGSHAGGQLATSSCRSSLLSRRSPLMIVIAFPIPADMGAQDIRAPSRPVRIGDQIRYRRVPAMSSAVHHGASFFPPSVSLVL